MQTHVVSYNNISRLPMWFREHADHLVNKHLGILEIFQTIGRDNIRITYYRMRHFIGELTTYGNILAPLQYEKFNVGDILEAILADKMKDIVILNYSTYEGEQAEVILLENTLDDLTAWALTQ